MAKKGSQFRTYSKEFKEKILREYFDGQGGCIALGKKYGIPHQSISNWVLKAKKNIDVSSDGRGRSSTGRPKTKNLTLEDYKERYEILKKYQAFLQARREKK